MNIVIDIDDSGQEQHFRRRFPWQPDIDAIKKSMMKYSDKDTMVGLWQDGFLATKPVVLGKRKRMIEMNQTKIYIVASYTDTCPGKLITARARLKFWNRYEGDTYSHVSISMDPTLTGMYSFARRIMHNPFNAGLIRENIREGMFARKPHINRMAVLELEVTAKQYEELGKRIGADWKRRDSLKYNFLGIAVQLLFACGAGRRDHYFCSQWIAELLGSCGIDLFHKKPVHVRPFDFYVALKNNLIYEGLVKDYCLDLLVVEKGAC